jgi:aminoglycoside phosphotransferase (APT) family kinase protein
MIRPQDLIHLLETTRDTLAGELLPDLQSPSQRANADALVMVLNRVVTDLKVGDDIANQHMDLWLSLRNEWLSGNGKAGGNTGSGGGLLAELQAFQNVVDDLQTEIGSESGFKQLCQRLESGDDTVRHWLARAVDGLVHLTSDSRTRVAHTRIQEQQEEPDDRKAVLQERLNRYLEDNYTGLPSDPVEAFSLVPGGYSKVTALVTLKENIQLPTKLVLRMDMANSVTDTSVKEEFEILKDVNKLDLPVPEALLLEADSQYLGGSFLLMTEIENEGAFGPYFPVERLQPPAPDPAFGKSLARTLAILHANTLTDDVSEVPNYQRQIEQARSSWLQTPNAPNTLIVELAYAWLLSHPRDQDRPWCRIHGDFGAHNMLIKGGELVGLIDWELSRTGDPAEDLAQCRMMVLPGIMEWSDFVDAYISAGGNPAACDERSVAYFCIWVFISHLTGHAVLREKYFAGERTDALAAKMVGYYSALLTDYLSQSMKLAIEAEK